MKTSTIKYDPGLLARREWLTLIGLAIGTGILYFWNLTANGYANSFYAAAVQAGTKSWKAFLFGSFDASNAITVDKPPASLWVMELTGRLFGFNSFTMLAPEVLMGVVSVCLLFLLLRKNFGYGAGLIAALTLALTPVAALMFRFNNPDAMLVLLMIVSVGGTLRLNDTGNKRWAWLIGGALGLAFLVKSFQAFLILPALALPYLLFGRPKLGRRLRHLILALIAMIIAGGWWLLLVELWPASDRPYIGGSQNNSALDLILGYNGFGRLTGNETGSVGGMGGGSGGNWGATGILRLFTADFGGQIAWLMPLALLSLLGGAYLFWRTRRTAPHFFQLLVWGLSFLITTLTFSFMAGIFHQYYTVALAPYVAALVGIAASTAWRWRAYWLVRVIAGLAVVGSAIWAAVLLQRGAHPIWLMVIILVAATLGAVGLQFIHTNRPVLHNLTAIVTLISLLAGPSYYTLYTIATAHSGSIVTAGPNTGNGFGGGMPGEMGAGMNMPPGKNAGGTGMGTPPGQTQGGNPGGTRQGGGAGFGQPGTTNQTNNGTGTRSQQLGDGGNQGAGGLLNASTPSSKVIKFLQQHADQYDWVLATVGSQAAAGYQLATGSPVMSTGGFNGTDPYPTLAQFEKYVAAGRIHYYLASSGMGGQGTNNTSTVITTWVKAHYKTVTVDGTTFYDLTQPA